jgi:hypothetical protein
VALPRCNTVERIEASSAAYARDTRAIFELLKLRMDRENSELYPLADREGAVAAEERSRASR